jgi:hypothetical protein
MMVYRPREVCSRTCHMLAYRRVRCARVPAACWCTYRARRAPASQIESTCPHLLVYLSSYALPVCLHTPREFRTPQRPDWRVTVAVTVTHVQTKNQQIALPKTKAYPEDTRHSLMVAQIRRLATCHLHSDYGRVYRHDFDADSRRHVLQTRGLEFTRSSVASFFGRADDD